MWKRISKILQANENHARREEEKAQRGEIFKVAMVKIEQAIYKNTRIWENVRKNKEELYQKIEQIKYAIEQEETALQYALRSKNKSLASSHILQKENLERQKKEFEALYAQVLQTWQQMELQKQKLTLQLQELKTKEVLLTNRLQNAKNQRELQLVLDDLEISDEIDLFEDKVNQAQIEVDLVDGVLDIENQMEGLQANSLDELDKKFDAYQQKEQDKIQEKQRKRVEQIFSRNENKTQAQKADEKKQLEEKRKQLLEQFKETHHKTVNESDNQKLQDDIKAHFEKANAKEDKRSVLNDFFSQTEKTEKEDTSKKSVIDDFFNQDEKQQGEKPTQQKNQKTEQELTKEEQMKKFFGK